MASDKKKTFSRDFEIRELPQQCPSSETLLDLQALFDELHQRPHEKDVPQKKRAPLEMATVTRALLHRTFHWVVVYEKKTGRLVGMGTITCAPDPELGGTGHIDNIVTLPAYQGRGIARRVVAKLLSIASEEYGPSFTEFSAGRNFLVSEVRLTSAPWREAANALYQKIGFERHDTNHYRIRIRDSKK